MEAPHMQLATMSRGYVLSRAIHTVAQLGLANHMSQDPISAQELAKISGTKPELLDRLLKFLSAYQLFNHHPTGYTLTPLSQPLRDDDPHSIRAVLCMADEYWWQAFSQLNKSLKTGKSAFWHQHGDDFFNFLSKSPESQKNFDEGMAKLSLYDDESIAKGLDFSSFSSIIDMGGGRGGLVKSLAKHYPSAHLTLLDTPFVINQLQANDFPSTVTLLAGDFLGAIPSAQAYIFKGVLHDFNDELMQTILKNCRQQMPKNATLLIAEQVMPDTIEPHPNKTMDIVMMALLGGRQRSLKEWREYVENLGFSHQGDCKTQSLFSIMAFKPTKS